MKLLKTSPRPLRGAQYPGVAGAAVNAPGENVVGNLTWTISPRMVNEAEFAYTQGTFLPHLRLAPSSTRRRWRRRSPTTQPIPIHMAASRTSAYSDGTTGLASGVTPYSERNLDRNLFDNFSVTLGQHTIRVGASVAQMLKTENASSGAANFQFNSFQDFLLGNVPKYAQASRDTIPDLHYINFEAYAQDDWRVSQNLTLNLGLRYSYFPSPADVNDTLNNFDPTLIYPAKAPTIDPVSGNFVRYGAADPSNLCERLHFPHRQGLYPGTSHCSG